MFKYRKKQEADSFIEEKVVEMVSSIRVNHKRMGCRKIYHINNQEISIGRDKFEQIAFSYGYKLKLKRNIFKTTYSQRVKIYPNLIEGIILNNINMVWQSDIF